MEACVQQNINIFHDDHNFVQEHHHLHYDDIIAVPVAAADVVYIYHH